MHRLGCASMKDEAAMLKHGTIINCPVTPSNVYRAQRIYGNDVATLKGKTESSLPTVVKIEHIPRPVDTRLSLHVDVMFIEGYPFLVSLSKPLYLLMASALGNTPGGERSEHALLKTLNSQVDKYKGQHFIVGSVLTDGEGGVISLKDTLNAKGIGVHPAGPGEHVPAIENKIKQIKQRTRAHLNVLPFTLASTLLVWLVAFCVSRINLVPSDVTGDRISPREKFTGRKLDFQRDLRVGFGDYVQTHEPNIIKNSQVARTEGAIALLPLGNITGSVKFFKLSTRSIITRDKFTVLPMPDTVISYMNAYAGAQKRQLRRDPAVVFRRRRHRW
jgi:hypothetical protein